MLRDPIIWILQREANRTHLAVCPPPSTRLKTLLLLFIGGGQNANKLCKKLFDKHTWHTQHTSPASSVTCKSPLYKKLKGQVMRERERERERDASGRWERWGHYKESEAWEESNECGSIGRCFLEALNKEENDSHSLVYGYKNQSFLSSTPTNKSTLSLSLPLPLPLSLCWDVTPLDAFFLPLPGVGF